MFDDETYAAAKAYTDAHGGSGGGVTKEYVDEGLAEKVDKVAGKGLSTNDYDNAEKGKVAEAAISVSSTGTSFSLTDAADGNVQNIIIKGRTDSTTAASVGDNGLTITTTDGTASTSATITTALPLCSLSESLTDELDMVSGVVRKKCEKKNLNDFDWALTSGNRWRTQLNNAKPVNSNNEIINAISNNYTAVSANGLYANPQWIGMALNTDNELLIRNGSDTDTPTGDIVYELATPYDAPLTPAEITALTNLKTYTDTTNISCTDSPIMTVDYLLNTDNGQAIAKIDRKNSIKSLTYTGTGEATNTIVFPETPLFVLGISGTPGTDSRGYVINCDSFVWSTANIIVRWSGNSTGSVISDVAYSGNTATIIGETAAAALNYTGAEYTVYYI